MTDHQERQRALVDALEERILVLDGAMGTMLQQAHLGAADFGGPDLEGCNENLVRTRPDVVLGIHRAYLEAGADIVETNTFGGARSCWPNTAFRIDCGELNRTAARLARQAADEFSTPARPRFVAGSMGPTTKAITRHRRRHLSTNCATAYHEQARALVEGGADFLLLETCQDTRNVKAALLGHPGGWSANSASAIPVIVSGTIEPMGTMLAGQTADAFWVSVAHADLLAVGLNCATGPEFMTDHIRTLHELAWTAHLLLPQRRAAERRRPVPGNARDRWPRNWSASPSNGWLNLVGGCCGTTPAHIRAIAQMVEGKAPRARARAGAPRTFFSGIELVEAEESNRPLMVGERTNVIGSRLFKNLIAEEKWEEASEIARRQVRNGAHIVDVCLQSSDRDEIAGHPALLRTADPQDQSARHDRHHRPARGRTGAHLLPGQEHHQLGQPRGRRGEVRAHRARSRALTARRSWSGAIDEDPRQAQAFTRERKLAVAQRSVDLLTDKYGIPAEDIIIDPLVFPCATGDENYIGGAVETIEARAADQGAAARTSRPSSAFRTSPSACPPAAREVVNSVFLYYAPRRASTWPSSTPRSSSASPPSRTRSAAWPSTCSSTRRRRRPRGTAPGAGGLARADPRAEDRHQPVPHRRHRRPFPQAAPRRAQKAADLPLDERLAQLHRRRHQGRPDRRPGPQAPGRRARRSTSSTGR